MVCGVLAPQGLARGRIERRCSAQSATRRRAGRSSRVVWCCAAGDEPQAASKKRDAKSTIAGIDALLGIDEEEERRKEEEKEKRMKERDGPLDTAMSAEARAKLAELGNEATISAVQEVIDAAGKVSNSKGTEESLADLEKAIKRAKESGEGGVTPKMVTVIKSEILGTSSFLVTDVEYLTNDFDRAGGVDLIGNCRIEPADAAKVLTDGLTQRYGDEFVVFLKPDDRDSERQFNGKPRVCLSVLPRVSVAPPTPAGWQLFLAFVLFGLTVASTLSLAALVSVPKLPAETLAWLAGPDTADALDAGAEVPGLDNFNAIPFVSVFSDTLLGILAVSGLHEVGHSVAARLSGLKLAPTLFIPNGSLGTFGAVTRPESIIASRRQLWDFAAAGPIAGLAAGGALFAAGLALSTDASADPSTLIPVPTFLFQGSIILGSICEALLGPASGGKQLVHPLLIAGWCGLFTQAFNLLPVGCLDGGRMTQAAYGRLSLNFTSVITYIGLALGVIGGTLSLPFGIFVILAQRTPERSVADEFSEVSDSRQVVTAILVTLAVLVLVPFTPDAPELLDSMQAGLAQELLSAAPVDPGLNV